ncbi:hypothetical protein ARMGADRAFT_78224 [Armillaria gallica]|uniref:Uncharacterized protein n=1 Tax=Armillaria gallica TaxID=47427 RepID=A0A2H3CYS2_ARMGA|nr:hypothetical protein ARMGADRAFT_78224 [Armillaria gallica]
MVAKTMHHVANFAANRIAYMTFNYTSLPENRDCILLAWLPDADPGHHFAQSQVFSVTDPETTTSRLISSGISSTLSVSRCARLLLVLGFRVHDEYFPTEPLVIHWELHPHHRS